MSLVSFFKSMVSPEAMGDKIIATQERLYGELAANHPDREPHQLLAQVWLGRMAAHGNDVRNELFQQRAFSDTIQCACLPPPKKRTRSRSAKQRNPRCLSTAHAIYLVTLTTLLSRSNMRPLRRYTSISRLP
jgi:hypothetical protein